MDFGAVDDWIRDLTTKAANARIARPVVHPASGSRKPTSTAKAVEPRGIEPLTFSLRTKRSTN